MTRVSPDLLAALDPLLEQALDLPPAELTAWLDQLQQSDASIAAELRLLLRAENRLDSGGFLRSKNQVDLYRLGAHLAGQRIGSYILERPLGRGGMGSVWLAQRSDGRFEGRAAVKLLNLALVDPIGMERFKREGTVLAQLTHPNIARLLDAGVSDTGQPFLVLEYVEGRRIDLYCDERRLGPVPRLALFRQVLSAVADAHAHLVVHRDLKPANILVTSDGSVKLLDFGIAKLLEGEAAAAERTDLTAGGGTPLTPEFAAPEQVLGGPVTTATDVYSLGVLLYLLLAGRHPTSGGALTTAGHLSGILDTEPARLSTAVAEGQAVALRSSTAERLRRLYRGDLDNILAKALRKDPTERYATVTAFDEDLGRHLRHEPVQARPDSFGYRTLKFVRRNRGRAVAAALIASALIGATVLTTQQMLEARRQRDEARVQRDRARFEEQRATASSGFMQTLLHTIAPARLSYTTTELLDQARAILETDYQGDPRFVARMMIELSEHYAGLNNTATEAALLARAGELASRAGDLEIAGWAQCGIGLLKALAGEGDSARFAIRKGQSLLPVTRNPPSTASMLCLQARARVAGQTAMNDSSLSLARQAVALGEAAGDTSSLRYSAALQTLSGELYRVGRVRDAWELNRRTMAVLERIGRRNTLPMLAARLEDAGYLRDLGEMRGADSALADAMPLVRRMDPQYVPWYTSILAGDLATLMGRPDSAVAHFRRAVANARRTGERRTQRWPLMHLTGILLDQGRVAEAQQNLAELATLFPDSERATYLGALNAELIQAQGDTARAYRRYGDLLTQYGLGGSPPPRFHRLVFRVAHLALAAGDAVAADSLARHVLRLQRGLGQDETKSGDMGRALLLLARARVARGDSAGGLDALARARRPLEHGLGLDHSRTREARALLDSLRVLEP